MCQLVDVEFEGHVYLDHHHPPILWNIVRGGFSSVDMLPASERSFAISVSLASMLQNSSADRLAAELALELVRRAVAPSSVSRLRGLFVFDEVASIARIWESNRWGGHFQDDYLADVGVYARTSSRLDANWIEDILHPNGSLQPNWQGAAANYWCGIPHPNHEPIWERIVDGTFCVWSMHSKEAALKEICAIWPNSLGLLVHSMNCFGMESLDGQCFPGLTANDGVISVDYFMRMVDSKNAAFTERLSRLPEVSPKCFAGHPDPSRMHLPDLTGYSTKIPLQEEGKFSDLAALLAVIQGGQPTHAPK